jgi:tRNA nucleotidyltransferase (CCA-adding enzyme)
MKIYLVGGAVRDELLGLPVAERDWVVVGADASMMRARGFVPADRTFPVFLHPDSGDEYALARREVKRGEGYRGFEVYAGPDVSLEEDLRRRDLTINAMARDEAGSIVDPYGGRRDLNAGLLRHVSKAFVEDPLRVLRIARFAAKLGGYGFHVAHGTHRLMCRMVADGEMAHLTAERLWREMVRAARADQPWRFFEVLHRCGALKSLIPPLAESMAEVTQNRNAADSRPIAALKRASAVATDATPRLAATLLGCVDSVAAAERLAARLCADRDTAQLLKRTVQAWPACQRAAQGDVDALYRLAVLWRAFGAGSEVGVEAAVCDAQQEQAGVWRNLQLALPAARAVSAAALREQGWHDAELGRQLAAARRDAMAAALRKAGLLT